jgi:hypothetical protein
MAQIDVSNIKKVKRPDYLLDQDLANTKIVMTKEEKTTFTVTEESAQKCGLEKSNIPDIINFDISVMAQIYDPIIRAVVCVNDKGERISTNKRDYDCATCDHFVNDKSNIVNRELMKRYPNGFCQYTVDAWIEKFGSLDNRPEGLDKIKEKMQTIGQHEQKELTQEEVLELAAGIEEDNE